LRWIKALLAASRQHPAMNSAHLAPPAVRILPPALLDRLGAAGPRYTSYPTADRFVEAHGHAQHKQALELRRQTAGAAAPLSVYVHVPFCESLCYYCACNKIVTKHHERAMEYLALLDTELKLWRAEFGARPQVSQLHLGGGTPTFFTDAELTLLMQRLSQDFDWLPGLEASIEIDPRTVTAARLAHLQSLGFNRISYGVQDFDPRVQQAVHRVQPFEQVEQLMRDARALQFNSINLDLICGLPLQTPQTFARTLAQVVALRPDRIALYNYAHMPQRFKAQRRIHAADLPPVDVRLNLHADAIATFMAAGYEHIGMDHFALPDDSLAQAKRQGRLHRNFQGYTVQPDGDLVGLGVSAISRVGATYAQSAKTLEEYADAMGQGQLPIVRGIALTRDDLVRRSAIMALMCQGRLDFQALSAAHLIDARSYFASELQALASQEGEGMVLISDQAVEVTPLGWYFVRSVASVFDRHLQQDRARAACAADS
jgi:oxygen-independent coproporphyrinogen-3 oxidase